MNRFKIIFKWCVQHTDCKIKTYSFGKKLKLKIHCEMLELIKCLIISDMLKALFNKHNVKYSNDVQVFYLGMGQIMTSQKMLVENITNTEDKCKLLEI